MLKKIILFSLAFVFTVATEAALQEDNLFDIGNQVYAISDRQLSFPFTFGRVGEIIDLNEVNMLTVQFEDGDTQTYRRDDLYVSEGCLRTFRGRVCVRGEALIDIYLPSLFSDPLISFGGHPRARVLAINESTNTIMVKFLESTASILSQGKPVVYHADDIAKGI